MLLPLAWATFVGALTAEMYDVHMSETQAAAPPKPVPKAAPGVPMRRDGRPLYNGDFNDKED
jgi:hypothetical protein